MPLSSSACKVGFCLRSNYLINEKSLISKKIDLGAIQERYLEQNSKYQFIY